MNTSDILHLIDDPSVTERVVSRRHMLRGSASGAAALALAGMPLGLALTATRAHAQSSSTPATVTAALQLALKLEYLEYNFYNTGYNDSTLNASFTDDERAAIQQIRKHELAHVTLLAGVLGSSAPAPEVTYDFTGGSGAQNGPFAPFSSKAEFFKLAQLFEDTGVRAYKGQAANLLSDDTALTVGLQIHSVEARHAAKLRRMRGQLAWITGAAVDAGYTTTVAGSGASQAQIAAVVYGGEDNVNQGVTLSGSSATEAFDEPISTNTVVTAAGLFGVT